MNKNIVLIIALVAAFSFSGVAFAKITFNTNLFSIFPVRVGVFENSSRDTFEVFKFTDGANTCYLSVSSDYQNGAPALDCVK